MHHAKSKKACVGMIKKLLSELIWVLALLFVLSPFTFAYAQEEVISDVDPLLEMSLEQLMSVEVTSVMKTATRLSDTPAAIYVLTSEDIRRSGVTTIPEALRIVPGMHVAQIDANKWAVTARGFNSIFANKLLVLVDGRSIYSPIFSGVWWDQQDVPMDDIERIEVIRGPGASLWGANAVNGVINITTKSAKNSQGGLVSAYVGDERGGADLRYGTKIGDDAYLKAYGHTAMHSSMRAADSDANANDLGRLNKGGFRFEKEVDNSNAITLQGDVFNGDSGGADQVLPNMVAPSIPVVAPPYTQNLGSKREISGFNLLGRWEHQISEGSNTALQAYWDHHQRDLVDWGTISRADTFDMDFQHNLHVSDTHNVVWGLGYRRNMNHTNNGNVLAYDRQNHSDNIYSVYAQDDVTLSPKRWHLLVGGRMEHNPITHFEFQPNARLVWTPSENQSFWASASRAVKTPSWTELDVNAAAFVIPPAGGGAASSLNPAVLTSVRGNQNIDSETLYAYELGWRAAVTSRLNADVALFYNHYEDLTVTLPLAPDLSNIASGYIVQNISYSNDATANSYGGEASLDWHVTNNWKLRASYSHFEIGTNLKTNVAFASVSNAELYPRHQATVWTQHQITPEVNLDVNVRYVGRIDSTAEIADYTALDARLAWTPSSQYEFALVGRNLLDPKHVEIGRMLSFSPSEIPREFFITGRIKF